MRLIDADALKFGLEKVTLYVHGLRFGKTVLGKILEEYRRAVFEEIGNAPTIIRQSCRLCTEQQSGQAVARETEIRKADGRKAGSKADTSRYSECYGVAEKEGRKL